MEVINNFFKKEPNLSFAQQKYNKTVQIQVTIIPNQSVTYVWCHQKSRSTFLIKLRLYPKRGQKQNFFDPLQPHLVHVAIECPLKFQRLLLSLLWIDFHCNISNIASKFHRLKIWKCAINSLLLATLRYLTFIFKAVVCVWIKLCE